MSVLVGLSTLALVVITGWYAVSTQRMVKEMRTGRLATSSADRSARARPHALAARSALLDAGVVDFTSATQGGCWELYRSLSEHGPLVDHHGIRIRVRVAALVAFTGSWKDEGLQPSPALARIQTRVVGGAVLVALECYLRGEPLPRWPEEFPLPQWAQAWTVAAGAYTEAADDEAHRLARLDLVDADREYAEDVEGLGPST